ncbi:hypothetical protein B296_00004265 [Ensete ventricosum]|uniref:Uncharacterized protein n=1 Tax=Ensete ventricosum TaxID=4639 RepID=A0A426ZTA8_ENSVE|nr:hypothetical protein B296_00004265 [Ensete ventricosum]
MVLSLLPPQREGRAHVRGAWLESTSRPRCTARGPPSSANMIRDILVGRRLVRPVGTRGIVRFWRTRTVLPFVETESSKRRLLEWPYHFSLYKGREGLMSEVLGSGVLVDRGARLGTLLLAPKMLVGNLALAQ